MLVNKIMTCNIIEILITQEKKCNWILLQYHQNNTQTKCSFLQTFFCADFIHGQCGDPTLQLEHFPDSFSQLLVWVCSQEPFMVRKDRKQKDTFAVTEGVRQTGAVVWRIRPLSASISTISTLIPPLCSLDCVSPQLVMKTTQRKNRNINGNVSHSDTQKQLWACEPMCVSRTGAAGPGRTHQDAARRNHKGCLCCLCHRCS